MTFPEDIDLRLPDTRSGCGLIIVLVTSICIPAFLMYSCILVCASVILKGSLSYRKMDVLGRFARYDRLGFELDFPAALVRSPL